MKLIIYHENISTENNPIKTFLLSLNVTGIRDSDKFNCVKLL